MNKLEQMATIQLQVIDFFEEPERAVMQKLTNAGLYEVGQLMAAIFKHISDTGLSNDVEIQII